MIDEMELLSRMGEIEALRPEALTGARAALREAIGLEARPVEVLPHRRGRAGRPGQAGRNGGRVSKRAVAVRVTAGLGIAAATATIALTATSSDSPANKQKQPQATSHPAKSPLLLLADYIQADDQPLAGNATLVIHDQHYPDSQAITGADLYTDSGQYFYAPEESGLPAAIADDDDQGDGMFAREQAAAEYAVNGSLTTARIRMAEAPMAQTSTNQTSVPSVEASRAQQALEQQALAKRLGVAKLPTVSPSITPVVNDNMIWEDSLDALSAGAGKPDVRVGVLRILSTLPEVTVTDTTTDGQPSLTLTASAPALPVNYQEALTINATTGIPLAFSGGTPGQTPGVTVTYQVSRVTVANIAAGKF